MEAGSDTTASTLLSFLMAMAKHPEVLKKCQDEVDGVCGLERSPGIQDAQNLPYLRAVMQEVSKIVASSPF
jgi:cytochrome P450